MRTVNASDFLKDFYMYLSIAENGEDFVVIKDGVEVVKVSNANANTHIENKKTADFSKWIGILKQPNVEDIPEEDYKSRRIWERYERSQ